MLRSVLVAALMLAVLAPSAHAAVADAFLPYVDASDDVHVGKPKQREVSVRFGPKAAKLYRTLAGREYSSGCRAEQPRGMSSGGGLTAPRKRSRLTIATGPRADVCFISSAERASDDSCVYPWSTDDRPRECVRVVVALTPRGRAMVDEISRTLEIGALFFEHEVPFAELQEVLGPDIAPLPSPDAAPAPGVVGVFDDGRIRVVAAMLADGRRWYARTEAGVYSTNVPRLFGDRETLTLF